MGDLGRIVGVMVILYSELQDGVRSYVEDILLMRIVKGTELVLFVGKIKLLFILPGEHVCLEIFGVPCEKIPQSSKAKPESKKLGE